MRNKFDTFFGTPYFHMVVNKRSFTILVLALLGCGEINETSSTVHSGFLPMTGWVLVMNGSVEEVKAAIMDYDSLAREEAIGTFKVELHRQKDGSIAVIFPDGLPSYDITNITVWLDAPPDQHDVYGAKSWVHAPGSSKKYFLKPEIENEWGDTLLGAGNDGGAIRIYVPETGISEISQTIEYESEQYCIQFHAC